MAHRLPAFTLCLALFGALPAARAQVTTPVSFDTGHGNLMVVLRESAGANKQDEVLKPYGKLRTTLDNGREVEFETSWYQYLGDMHLRLVFDGPQSMQSASPEDLTRLRLAPQQALDLAVANLRRVYGAPSAHPWSGRLMQVRGAAPDLDSSYFLDRAFWLDLQRQHPQGLVVAVPRRGGLVYAPRDDEVAVDQLRFAVTALYAGSGGARVSSALYLFKDGGWSVFQPPMR